MKPLIIAHRGASAFAPENTIAAFQKALDAGADGIEFDVRLTKDGKPVVFHDRTLKRVTGIEDELIDTLFADLEMLDAGKWFDKKTNNRFNENFADARIPSLGTALDFLRVYRGTIYIELKGKDQNIVELAQLVAAELKKRKLKADIVVKSFKLSAIPVIKLLLPNVRTAALFAPKIRNILRKEKYLVQIAEDIGADELSVHFTLATKKLLRTADKKGLPIVVWTVNNPRWVKRAIKLGIKALITNDPKRLIESRDELLGAGQS